MADFCMQCSLDNFNEDMGDLRGIADPGKFASVICEGCGFTTVDSTGQCVSVRCLEHHGEKHAECKEACQHAVQYGVWPESSCDPRCMWKRYNGNPINTPPSDAEKARVQADVRRAALDIEQNLKLNKE